MAYVRRSRDSCCCIRRRRRGVVAVVIAAADVTVVLVLKGAVVLNDLRDSLRVIYHVDTWRWVTLVHGMHHAVHYTIWTDTNSVIFHPDPILLLTTDHVLRT